MAFDRGSPTVAAFWLGRTEHDLVLPRAKVEKDILPFLAVKKGGLELAAFVLKPEMRRTVATAAELPRNRWWAYLTKVLANRFLKRPAPNRKEHRVDSPFVEPRRERELLRAAAEEVRCETALKRIRREFGIDPKRYIDRHDDLLARR